MNMQQVKFISELFDHYDGKTIDSYIKSGGFKGFETFLKKGIGKTVDEIASSGLQGRGGAAYPTGKKLTQARAAKGVRKFVVCNADEGEPGTFKDRELLKQNIFQVIEGMIIAGACADAKEGIIYVREEYKNIHDQIASAIEQCYEYNYLGKNIQGSSIDFDLRLFSGAGAYVCGEGFAMCESLEGKSGRPRSKPPYVKQEGFLNFPTLVINTETLSAMVSILRKGADRFKEYGTDYSTGTKLISISGKVNKPGVYEIPFGCTIQEIIDELAGGMKDGSTGNFVQIGGASGGILPRRLWNTRYTYEDLEEKGLSVGSGAIVVADREMNILRYLQIVQDFFRHESCGKCTPCREGNRQLHLIFQKMVIGKMTRKDFARLDMVLDLMKKTSLCGSGKTEVVPFITAKKYFPKAFTYVEFPQKASPLVASAKEDKEAVS
ncbi:MAG TPA: NADH-quinone oxidoreductase subunit F [Eubacteriaceae bacterium]|nr:NADH-quinone oxidoreductase subunit F [Eubacteriaceae bacterium]